jgi:signal peptidase I
MARRSRDELMRVLAGVLAGTLAVLGAGVWVLRRRLAIVTVAGESMEPAFRDGDRVLVRRTRPADLRRGQVVVIEQPEASGACLTAPIRWPPDSRDWIIKRVGALPGEPCPDLPGPASPVPAGLAGQAGQPVPRGKVVVLGDNRRRSFDSRVFGYYPADRILGIAVRPVNGR